MSKRSFILALVIAGLLLWPQQAAAQAPIAQFFAYSRVYPTGADGYVSWGPTGSMYSGIQRASPVGITDFYYGHYFEAGQSLDCRVGYDCLSHPYVSSGDTSSYQFIDIAWYFSLDGPYRFKVENTGGYQHTGSWLNGSTWVMIGQPQTNSFTSLPYVFMGYESLSNTKLDRPMYFANAKYYAYGAWNNFCPTTFLDQGNNGAMLYPCIPSFPGAFNVVPGVRAFLPQQMRP